MHVYEDLSYEDILNVAHKVRYNLLILQLGEHGLEYPMLPIVVKKISA
jgi:hypothetical protein